MKGFYKGYDCSGRLTIGREYEVLGEDGDHYIIDDDMGMTIHVVKEFFIIAGSKWDKRFMEMAELVSTWTSCFRVGRQVGAVIVKDNRILTTGYNGAPAGIKSCREKCSCMRDELHIPSGTQAQLDYAIHAEQNAIIQAARLGTSIDGATLYCTHQPCSICMKMIINAGIVRIVYKREYPDDFAIKLVSESGIIVEQYKEDLH